MPNLSGKKIILGITGGIAAYKTPHLVRLLIKQGAEVQVVMTPSASMFVAPETLSVVSGKPVLRDFFSDEEMWNNHVALGLWADALLIAPASANTLAKMAMGNADNLLLTIYLSMRSYTLVAPAMDLDMYKHPSFLRNMQVLASDGVGIIEAETGDLASGLVGQGRMAEPEHIAEALFQYIANHPIPERKECAQPPAVHPFEGKRVLVTAGPTYENIDPVRFIGNHSSGKMGFAIAEAFAQQGAHVTLVSGPVHLPTPFRVDRVNVVTAEQMLDACLKELAQYDIAVLSAAVADYRPLHRASEKLKKTADEMVLTLVKNPDILATLGGKKRNNQCLVGFALETQNEEIYAKDKLHKKNCDLLVLNSLQDSEVGFGKDTNKVTIFDAKGGIHQRGPASKKTIALQLSEVIYHYIQALYAHQA